MADIETSTVPTTEISEIPCDPPAVEIPSSFAEHFLWPHTPDGSHLAETLPPSHQFSEATVQEIQAAAICAFDRADDKNIQSITLFCPYEGGHPFVDSMVKLIASRSAADVLVLDALELASVEYGAMGEAGGGIGSFYKTDEDDTSSKSDEDDTSSKSDEDDMSSNNDEDEKTQRYVDALVNISATRNSPGTGNNNCLPTSRRIVYLKDYGSIASISQPLLDFIVRSIQKRNKTVENADSLTSSTILVFGIASGIRLISEKDDDSDPGEKCRTEWYNAIRAGGETLGRIMPEADHEFPTMIEDEPSCSRLCSLSAQFFLPRAYDSSDLRRENIDRPYIFEDELISYDFTFAILPRNAHSEESRAFRRVAIEERTRDINEALLRLSVGKLGSSLMDGRLSDTAFEGNNKSREHVKSSILSPPAAEMIAVTAIGLVKAESSVTSPKPSTKSTDLLHISPSNIVKAFEIHLQSLQVRKDWIEKDMRKFSGPAHKDPRIDVVEQVTKCCSLSDHEKKLLGCIVKPEMLTITFDDVCAEPTVIETLRSMVSLPLLFPEQFAHGILARQGLGGVLLYGPPGTGKTTLCRALAYDCGAQMLVIKPSDIFDMWVGESQKMASAVFSLARRLSPCVIFIDEADTLFAERDESNSSWRDDTLTEFLQEMDGFASASKNTEQRVVIIAATNRPFNLDPAVLRRLPRRMMVGMPRKEERRNILKIHLTGETLHDEVDLEKLAGVTQDYSGSDLKDLCVSAVMGALKEAVGKPDWKRLRKHTHLDTEPQVDKPESLIEGDGESQASQPLRVVTKAHFEQALVDIRPSFSERAQAEMMRWHKENSAATRA